MKHAAYMTGEINIKPFNDHRMPYSCFARPLSGGIHDPLEMLVHNFPRYSFPQHSPNFDSTISQSNHALATHAVSTFYSRLTLTANHAISL